MHNEKPHESCRYPQFLGQRCMKTNPSTCRCMFFDDFLVILWKTKITKPWRIPVSTFSLKELVGRYRYGTYLFNYPTGSLTPISYCCTVPTVTRFTRTRLPHDLLSSYRYRVGTVRTVVSVGTYLPLLFIDFIVVDRKPWGAQFLQHQHRLNLLCSPAAQVSRHLYPTSRVVTGTYPLFVLGSSTYLTSTVWYICRYQ